MKNTNRFIFFSEFGEGDLNVSEAEMAEAEQKSAKQKQAISDMRAAPEQTEKRFADKAETRTETDAEAVQNISAEEIAKQANDDVDKIFGKAVDDLYGKGKTSKIDKTDPFYKQLADARREAMATIRRNRERYEKMVTAIGILAQANLLIALRDTAINTEGKKMTEQTIKDMRYATESDYKKLRAVEYDNKFKEAGDAIHEEYRQMLKRMFTQLMEMDALAGGQKTGEKATETAQAPKAKKRPEEVKAPEAKTEEALAREYLMRPFKAMQAREKILKSVVETPDKLTLIGMQRDAEGIYKYLNNDFVAAEFKLGGERINGSYQKMLLSLFTQLQVIDRRLSDAEGMGQLGPATGAEIQDREEPIFMLDAERVRLPSVQRIIELNADAFNELATAPQINRGREIKVGPYVFGVASTGTGQFNSPELGVIGSDVEIATAALKKASGHLRDSRVARLEYKKSQSQNPDENIIIVDEEQEAVAKKEPKKGKKRA
jgi:hypothetical protein